MIYSSAANNNQSYDICQRDVRVTYDLHACSGKIRFLTNKSSLHCSEKPEVDLMMPSLASETQIIQWQCNKKQLSKFADK